jgi:hypothetical protein
MGEVKTEMNKLSYEELEKVANELYTRLQQSEMSNVFKRLDYLFKIVENIHSFPEEFQKKCIEEIVSFMTIPEDIKTEE